MIVTVFSFLEWSYQCILTGGLKKQEIYYHTILDIRHLKSVSAWLLPSKGSEWSKRMFYLTAHNEYGNSNYKSDFTLGTV